MICTIFYGKSVFLRPHKYMFPTHIVYIIVINAVQMYIFVYFTYISKVESLVFNRIFITYIALFSLAFFVNLISVEMRGSFDFFFLFAFLSSSGVSSKSPHNLCKTVAKLHHRKIHFNYIY